MKPGQWRWVSIVGNILYLSIVILLSPLILVVAVAMISMTWIACGLFGHVEQIGYCSYAEDGKKKLFCIRCNKLYLDKFVEY